MFKGILRDWILGDMGNSGDFQYQAIHWYTLAVVLTVSALIFTCGYLCRKDPRRSRKLLVAVSVFQLAFEVVWRLVYFFVKHSPIQALWPLYPCNLGGILVPIIALCGNRRGKQMFYLFGFVGGCLTFALPAGIFVRDVLVFSILKSILQHTGLLLIPTLEYIAGTYRARLKDLGWVVLGCLVHVANCEGIDRLLGFTEDYMFFRSGMPFVIPGVPQFITLSVFALAVLALLSFLSDIKGSLRSLRRV